MRLAQSFRALAILLDSLAERNCGRGKSCIAPGAMMARLPAAMRLGQRLLFPAPAQLAIERLDSS